MSSRDVQHMIAVSRSQQASLGPLPRPLPMQTKYSPESLLDAACLLGAALEALVAGIPGAGEQAREALALTAHMRGVR